MKIVNMGQEMYNDALYFVEQARACYNKQFSLWRNCRMALYCMCQSAESDMSKLIVISLERIGLMNLDAVQSDLYDHLTNPTRSNDGPHRLIKNIYKKYGYLCELNGIPNAMLPSDYEQVIKLRNKITHYSFSKNSDVYLSTMLVDTERALGSVRDFIKHIWKVASSEYPRWIDQTAYKEIE